MLNPNRIFYKIHDTCLFHYDSPLSVPLVRVSNRRHKVVTSDFGQFPSGNEYTDSSIITH
jgi:hypothetical protein